jgi:hypothetical protein
MARARNKTNELCLNRLRHNRKVTDTQITQMFDNLSKSFVSERSHMWHEIDEGLRRFLIMPADKSKNGTQLEGEMINQHGFLIRSFHGHQFRDLIRRNKYNVAQQKPDAIMFGHFHLLAVFRKFDTWVLITGHFTGHHMPREKGFLCHVGAPIMTVELKTNEPFFKLNRARVS